MTREVYFLLTLNLLVPLSESLHSWTRDQPLFGSCYSYDREWQKLSVSSSFSLELMVQVSWAKAGHLALPTRGRGWVFFP